MKTEKIGSAEFQTWTVEEVAEAWARDEIVLIDVRTPQEWNSTGVAENAHTVAMQDPALGAKLDSLTAGNTAKPVALICATGVRSGRVANAMARAGYTKVYSVDEGMHGSSSGPGWLRRGLPLAKPVQTCADDSRPGVQGECG